MTNIACCHEAAYQFMELKFFVAEASPLRVIHCRLEIAFFSVRMSGSFLVNLIIPVVKISDSFYPVHLESTMRTIKPLKMSHRQYQEPPIQSCTAQSHRHRPSGIAQKAQKGNHDLAGANQHRRGKRTQEGAHASKK